MLRRVTPGLGGGMARTMIDFGIAIIETTGVHTQKRPSDDARELDVKVLEYW